MTETISAFPLFWPAGWPRTPGHGRTAARFGTRERRGGDSLARARDVTVADATQRVLAELGRMGAREIIVSTNLALRRDGLPRSDQREPADPGVAVYWTDRTGADRCMAVDRYTKTAGNLAALAATLEAMRAIERHGGAEILDRAFTGFTALPPPSAAARAEPWWEVLGISQDAHPVNVEAAYRRRRAEAHPDRGGSAEAFGRVQRAFEQFQGERR